jgi:hypothetical protein
MIGLLYSTMTTALLTVRIEIADFDTLAAAILPFNLKVSFVHSDYSSQPLLVRSFCPDKLLLR